MLKLVLASCLVLAITAQHPTHPPPSHGGNDAFKFHFDDHSSYMIMETQSHCYIMKLTDAEKGDIKDPMKLETLEVQMVSIVGGGDASKLTDVDPANADHSVAAHCHHHQIVELTH